MNRLLVGVACAGLAAGWGTMAQARPIPDGGLTLKEIQAWLHDGGYKAEIATNKAGEDYVKSAAEGANFDILPMDCKNNRCQSITFSAGFDLKNGTTAEKMNAWNSSKRYTKAYIDSDNDPWVEYDANLSPGGTYESLDDDFAVWRMFLPDFTKHIDW